MSFRGPKNITKDIDPTLTDGADLRVLQALLLYDGHKIYKEPG